MESAGERRGKTLGKRPLSCAQIPGLTVNLCICKGLILISIPKTLKTEMWIKLHLGCRLTTMWCTHGKNPNGIVKALKTELLGTTTYRKHIVTCPLNLTRSTVWKQKYQYICRNQEDSEFHSILFKMSKV